MAYVRNNWFWICLGLAGTAIGIQKAYEERGILKIGGEWLILPLILMAVWMIKQFIAYVKKVFEVEEFVNGEDSGRDNREIQKRRPRSKPRGRKTGKASLLQKNGTEWH